MGQDKTTCPSWLLFKCWRSRGRPCGCGFLASAWMLPRISHQSCCLMIQSTYFIVMFHECCGRMRCFTRGPKRYIKLPCLTATLVRTASHTSCPASAMNDRTSSWQSTLLMVFWLAYLAGRLLKHFSRAFNLPFWLNLHKQHLIHRNPRIKTWMIRSRVTGKPCSSWTIKGALVTKLLQVGLDCNAFVMTLWYSPSKLTDVTRPFPASKWSKHWQKRSCWSCSSTFVLAHNLQSTLLVHQTLSCLR